MLKKLSCQAAAASLTRFCAEDVVNLAQGVSRATVGDVLSRLERDGVITRAPGPGRAVRGRPRFDYVWEPGQREALAKRLEGDFAALGISRVRPREPFDDLDLADAHPVDEALDQIKALVDAAATAPTPQRREALAGRAQAEYEVLADLSPGEARLGVARSQLARLQPVQRDPAPPEPVPRAVRGFWDRVVAEARAPVVDVLEHYGAKVAHSGSSGKTVTRHARVAAAVSAPADALTLILDTADSTQKQWLQAYAAKLGSDWAVLHVGGTSAAELQGQLRILLDYFVTPVSANTHIAVIADGTQRSRDSLDQIGHVFGDFGLVRTAMEATRDAFAVVAGAADDAEEILQFQAVSPTLEEPDWLSRGLRRRFLLDVMSVSEHISHGALLKAAMNNPVIVSTQAAGALDGISAFGELHIAGPRDVLPLSHLDRFEMRA